MAGSDKEVEEVGFTEDAKFSVAPVLYTTVSSYQDVRFEQIDESEEAASARLLLSGEAMRWLKGWTLEMKT